MPRNTPRGLRVAMTLVLSVIMAFGGVPTGAIADELSPTEVVVEELPVDQPIGAQSAGDIATGTLGTCSWRIDADGNLTIYPTDGVSGTFESMCSSNGMYTAIGSRINFEPAENNPFYEYKSQVTSATFAEGTHATSLSGMFLNYPELKSVDLSRLDTSECTSLWRLFSNCPKLESINLGNIDTSAVTSMQYMFEHCSSLESVDVSNLNTSSVTSMAYMFQGCTSLASIDITDLDTSNVTYMFSMFMGCASLSSIDVSRLDTSSVENMGRMFMGCTSLASIDVSNLDTSSVTNLSSMFNGCTSLASIDVSSFDTSKVKYMDDMFGYCTSLASADISGFSMDSSPEVDDMFANCTSLQSVNISGVDVSKAIGQEYMFRGCDSLQEVMTDGTADLDAVFPNGTDGLTIVDTSNPNPPKTSISTATVTGVDGWTYDATAHTLVPTVTLGGTALRSGTDYTLGGDVSARDAGDYTLTITGAGDYEGTVRRPYTVAARPVTVSADNKAKVAGQDDPQLTATVEGTLGGETVSYRLWRQPGEAAGTYTIWVSGEASQGGYALTFSPGTLTIAADPQNPEGLSILDQLRREYATAQDAADQATSAADALREELGQAQASYDLVVQGNEALVAQVRGAADELAAANATLAEATAAKEAATAAREQNESQITELNNNIAALEGAVGSAEQDVLAAQGNVDARQRARDAASSDVGTKQQAYESACETAASAGRQELQARLDQALAEYDSASAAVGTADSENQTAQDALAQAQQAEATAKSNWEAKDAASQQADQTASQAEQAKNAAETDKSTAKSALDAANAILAEKQEAQRKAQAALEDAQQAQASAASVLAEKQAAYDAAKQAYDDFLAGGTVAFFDAMGSTAASGYLTDTTSKEGPVTTGNNQRPATTFASHTEIGGEDDATALGNMLAAIQWIKYCNQIRAELNLPALLVTDELMASAERNANFSTYYYDHARTANGVTLNMADYHGGTAAENLFIAAYGMEYNYQGWFYEEKALWESLVAQNPNVAQYWLNMTGLSAYLGYTPNVGHYFNLANPAYAYTGIGLNFTPWNQLASGTPGKTEGASVQHFRSQVETTAYTVEEYEQRLLTYQNPAIGKINSASAALNDATRAKQVADTRVSAKQDALATANAALQAAQTAATTAQTTYDNAVAQLQAATSAYNAAASDAAAKKTVADNALGAYEQAQAATQAAAQAASEKQTAYEAAVSARDAAQARLIAAQKAVNSGTPDVSNDPAVVAALEALGGAQATLAQAEQDLLDAQSALGDARDARDQAQQSLAEAREQKAALEGRRQELAGNEGRAAATERDAQAVVGQRQQAYDEALASLNDPTLQARLSAAIATLMEAQRLSAAADGRMRDAVATRDDALAALNDATDIGRAQVTGVLDKTYTGQSVTQDDMRLSLTLVKGDRSETYQLVEGTDYTVSYANNTSAGPGAQVSFHATGSEGSGLFWGTKAVTFSITAKDLGGASVTEVSGWTYDGGTHSVRPKVVLDGRELVAGTDYTLEGASARDAGRHWVTVVGRGNYAGRTSRPYDVSRRSVTVVASDASKAMGATDPKLTATVSGLVGGDTITYYVRRAPGETAGTYAITASGPATQGNYDVTYRGATFRISTPAPAPVPHVSYRTPARLVPHARPAHRLAEVRLRRRHERDERAQLPPGGHKREALRPAVRRRHPVPHARAAHRLAGLAQGRGHERHLRQVLPARGHRDQALRRDGEEV